MRLPTAAAHARRSNRHREVFRIKFNDLAPKWNRRITQSSSDHVYDQTRHFAVKRMTESPKGVSLITQVRNQSADVDRVIPFEISYRRTYRIPSKIQALPNQPPNQPLNQPVNQPLNAVHLTQTAAWRQNEKMQLEKSNLEGAPVAKLTSSRTFNTPELRDTDCNRQNQPRCAERPTTIGSPCSAQYAWCDRWARYIRIPQFLLTRRRGDVSLNNLRAGSSKQEGNETYPCVILM